MSSTTRQYTVRLAAAGNKQLEADLRAVGASGEKNLRRIKTATKPASAGLRETDSAARQLKGGLHAIGQELPALQRLARFMGTTALVGGVVAFGKSSLDVGRQFQAMMQRVEAATGASETEIASLAAAAKELGATTAFTAMQAAEAIEVLAKNGVAVPDILNGALTSSVSLASALGAEVAPAADLVTDLMQQFSLEAGRLPEIVDRVTGAALKSKFGFDDLRLAVAQAGGVAGTAGVEIEDFLTVLAGTASSFASGSDAGTSFKTFLQRLTPESAKAAGYMQDLNLKFFDAQGNMKSMAEVAQVLQDGLAGLTEEARNEALKTVFGTDAIRTAAALAKLGAEGMRELAQGIGEVSAQEQAEVRLRGLDGALKEVAAAWEALQLESAQNGGLDVAEAFVRRLTDALRFLTENFQEVEEIAERVAQALTVYLVGKGMTLVIAKGVAMRAALIGIAAEVSGIGTAASRALGPMRYMTAAGIGLMRVLGGPLSLAITALSLASLAIDFDTASDAIERGDSAALKAAEALDAYQRASAKAAEEQDKLGGKISETTQKMLDQSKAELEQARTDLDRAYLEARQAMVGAVFDGSGIDDLRVKMNRQLQMRALADASPGTIPQLEDSGNDFLARISELAKELEGGSGTYTGLSAELDKLRAVGPDLEAVRDRILEILDSGDMLGGNSTLKALAEMADKSGLFEDQIAAIGDATSEADLASAYDDLTRALTEAVEAGKLLRSEQLSGVRENIKGLVDLEAQMDQNTKALERNGEISAEIDGTRPFDEAADSARLAAGEVERLNRVYSQYQNSRRPEMVATWKDIEFRAGAADAAKKGLRDLIGYAEGTDKGRGYNETLDYGRWTGGDVNLVTMTLDQILELQAKMLADPENRKAYGNGKGSSALGRYQIVSKTLRGLMEEMGLSGAERFDEDMQDRMADVLIERRGRSATGLRSEWEGLNRVSSEQIMTAYDTGASGRVAALDDQATKIQKVVAVGDDMLEQLRLEADLADRSVEEQARLTFQYEALKRAREAGIDPMKALTAEGRLLSDVINEQAAAYGKAVAAQDADTKSIAEQVEDYRSAISGLFDNFKPGGDGLEGFWDDFTQMAIDKLWQLAFDPVWQYLAELAQGLFSGIGLGAGAGGTGALTGLISALGFADGGALPGLADGGVPRASGRLDGTGGKRQDNLLFWGSKGEFMQPAAAVDFYGVEFMEAIRNRRLPKFADGGYLGGTSGGSGGGAFQFNQQIIDRVGVKVTTEETTAPDGSRLQRLILSEAVDQAMTTPGGAATRRLRGYGVKPQRPRR